jgi:hypothetical protein
MDDFERFQIQSEEGISQAAQFYNEDIRKIEQQIDQSLLHHHPQTLLKLRESGSFFAGGDEKTPKEWQKRGMLCHSFGV